VCDAYFPYSTTENYGGGELPIVTLPQRGMVAVGSMSNLIQVGSLPTVVIPYNDQTVSTSNALDACTLQTFTWTGAQSALVVNTGSNSVSLINIGGYSYPTGTVSVGTQPVAAGNVVIHFTKVGGPVQRMCIPKAVIVVDKASLRKQSFGCRTSLRALAGLVLVQEIGFRKQGHDGR